jgi:hypothetical protein
MTKKEEHIQPQETSTLAIISLVLGVVSMTGPGLLLGIPAIITGTIALKRNLAGRGLSVAGLTLGIVSTVISLLVCAFVIFMIVLGLTHPEEFRDTPRHDTHPGQGKDIPFEQLGT